MEIGIWLYAIQSAQSTPAARKRGARSPRASRPRMCATENVGGSVRINFSKSSTSPLADTESNPAACAACAVRSPTHHAGPELSPNRPACTTPFVDVKITPLAEQSASTGSIRCNGDSKTRAPLIVAANLAPSGAGRVMIKVGCIGSPLFETCPSVTCAQTNRNRNSL